ncbi:MAG: sigma-54 dependent DNA-binding response regulator [Candidatus Angelobacter sp.]|jgi:DNA-binding NtrC family response regulator|nr:sigma-54 dependent DNA-binding response regulator [Candidatus Angelobacter sp.]
MQASNPTLIKQVDVARNIFSNVVWNPIMPHAQPKVIIASPNADFRSQIHKILKEMHWPAEEAFGGADALNKIEGKPEIEAVLLDHWLPDLDVADLEHSLRTRYPALDVVLVDMDAPEPSHSNRAAVHSRTEELFWALRKKGAVRVSENAVKIPALAELGRGTQDTESSVTGSGNVKLPALAELGRDTQHTESSVTGSGNVNIPALAELGRGTQNSVEEEVAQCEPLPGMIGSGPKIAQISRLVRLVAPRKTSVLITGETGTGKEVVARALHALSARAERPLVVLNCAAIPEALLESELFGYSRGAFTGAVQPKMGRVQSADGGTLFLDEVGELPLALQAKLLRFLQEGEVQRLGSNEVVKVDCRVVAATNVDLAHPASDKNKPFRQDLYYRLAVFPIELPPLRERGEDILTLASHFLAALCKGDSVPLKTLDTAVKERLLRYAWPGNVRELQHCVERAFILSQNKSILSLEHLPSLISVDVSQSLLKFEQSFSASSAID